MITRVMSLPIWVRVVGTLLLVVGVTVAGLTAWSTRQQHRLALKQAESFAQATVHAILPGMLAVMASGDAAELRAFLDHLHDSPGMKSVHVIPAKAVTQQFDRESPGPRKPGALAAGRATREPAKRRAADQEPADATDQRVLRTGDAFYGVEDRHGEPTYRAIVPITARRDFLGRDCLGCHQVQEGTVLGAVSLAIGLGDVQRASRDFQQQVVLVAALLSGVLLWGAYLLSARTITRPLREVVAQMQDISAGHGDLTKRLAVTSHDEIGQLASSFNAFVDNLQGILGQARQAADHVSGAAQEMSAASEQLSSGAQQQASSLEETAASLEEMTGTVRQNADNARDASQLAAASRETAERGKTIVAQAVTSMDEITRASRRIAEIIAVIDDIAFQTNLLALNAAVEAARAGEQGRGFAVVATEVRSLAQRSASAAKEIKTLIADSVTKIDTGAALVNRSGETLEEIVTSAKRVSMIIAEIAAASQEQSTGIDQVNRAVLQMDQVVQQNAAQTEELSSTSQALADQAQRLQELVRRFKLGAETPSGPPPQAIAAAPIASRHARPHPPRMEPMLVSATSPNGKTRRHDGFEEF